VFFVSWVGVGGGGGGAAAGGGGGGAGPPHDEVLRAAIEAHGGRNGLARRSHGN